MNKSLITQNGAIKDPCIIAFYKYIPHSKLFRETDGYIVNDTSYIEISFSDQESSTNKLPFSPFP